MIRFLVDSSSDYTPALLLGRDVEYVPLSITVGGQTYKDGINLTKDEFYRLLQQSEDFPKTALPSPADFADIFEEAKQAGDELVCVLLASGLSGTYQSAITAAAMVDYDKIYIVDSCSAAYGIQMLVEVGEQLRRRGKTGAEIAARLEELKGRIRICAAPDTLEYLHKGGRLSSTGAAIGTAVSLKPVITVTPEGKVSVLQKCLGHGRAINFICSYLEKHPADPAFPIYPIYTCGHENADKLMEKLTEQGTKLHSPVQIGSTIGAHVGPEVYGLIYMEKE